MAEYDSNSGVGAGVGRGLLGGRLTGGGSILEPDYSDYSHVPFDEPYAIDPAVTSSSGDGRADEGGPITISAAPRLDDMNFPAKLHCILCSSCCGGVDVSSVISWLPHGRAWKVHRPREFMSTVAPAYFSQSKYTSFNRQVNGWGFRRISGAGPDANSYYHQLFLRGMPHLLKRMRRSGEKFKAKEKRKQRCRSNQGSLVPFNIEIDIHPDFQVMAESHPLPLENPSGYIYGMEAEEDTGRSSPACKNMRDSSHSQEDELAPVSTSVAPSTAGSSLSLLARLSTESSAGPAAAPFPAATALCTEAQRQHFESTATMPRRNTTIQASSSVPSTAADPVVAFVESTDETQNQHFANTKSPPAIPSAPTIASSQTMSVLLAAAAPAAAISNVPGFAHTGASAAKSFTAITEVQQQQHSANMIQQQSRRIIQNVPPPMNRSSSQQASAATPTAATNASMSPYRSFTVVPTTSAWTAATAQQQQVTNMNTLGRMITSSSVPLMRREGSSCKAQSAHATAAAVASATTEEEQRQHLLYAYSKNLLTEQQQQANNNINPVSKAQVGHCSPSEQQQQLAAGVATATNIAHQSAPTIAQHQQPQRLALQQQGSAALNHDASLAQQQEQQWQVWLEQRRRQSDVMAATGRANSNLLAEQSVAATAAAMPKVLSPPPPLVAAAKLNNGSIVQQWHQQGGCATGAPTITPEIAQRLQQAALTAKNDGARAVSSKRRQERKESTATVAAVATSSATSLSLTSSTSGVRSDSSNDQGTGDSGRRAPPERWEGETGESGLLTYHPSRKKTKLACSSSSDSLTSVNTDIFDDD